MTATTTDVSAAVARFAERFHAAVGTGHHVGSPLGAWLLLALCAAAAGPGSRTDPALADALGVSPEEARTWAQGLLAARHPLVLTAAAAWTGATAPPTTAPRLARDLPAAVATGPLPDQRALDAWAAENTQGLIDRFPVTVTPETLLVLATALATKVSWTEPFHTAPAADLRAGGTWAGRLTTVLRSPSGWGHVSYVARSRRAGLVAVHSAQAFDAESAHGLRVTSVIAEPGVPAADVLAAAYEPEPDEVSLFDLPLGEGPLWTITAEETRTTAADGREEWCTSVLPAWRAGNDHDLAAGDLGFPGAARALAASLGLPEFVFEARQAAVAAYSRYGFEAAAVSVGAVAGGIAAEPRKGVLRTAELRFAHPYAVVAVATGGDTPWDGLPVFSAWVADPEDAEE
ncbi:hypothetical protein [Virgisporangium ochraceum]|uniref:Proteinase inhibitor I4 serpin n=1 Tax=Virgisporangium ochraceum TaxID=65505 RepID=A0A8J4A5R2_9ACTN|nr:hypothetical protein [Virgisporangium ochraceum]GIJ75408.1 hypothetical protein Voc01_103250 [Virgisporangium ochraceum]